MYPTIAELVDSVNKDDIVTRFSPNPISELHSHKCLELAYVLQGTILHSIGGMTHIVKEGEFFIVDYDQPHSYLAVSDGDFRQSLLMASVYHQRFQSQVIPDTFR